MATILTIIPYPFYPPVNGGSLRCFYLLRSLAATHTVYLLTVQPEAEFHQKGYPPFPSGIEVVSLADTGKFRSICNNFLSERIADGLHTRLLLRSFNVSRNDFLLKAHFALQELTRKTDIDAVVYENLEAFVSLRSFWQRKNCRPLQILDAHNVDSRLWHDQAIGEGSRIKMKYSKAALATEKSLAKTTNFIFTCSQHDFKLLEALNKHPLKGAVVPNGVDIENNPFDTSKDKMHQLEILFCGSLSYSPNQEGLLWFYREVFPLLRQKLPRLTLTVVGQVINTFPFATLQADPSVNFIGAVPSVQPYYHRTSVAVVPLLKGSGTRLKILEAMSFGNPVVSTTKGAEGLILQEKDVIRVADDPESFARAILDLHADIEAFNRQRLAARRLVERLYDWKVIGQRLNQELALLLDNANKK